MVDWPTPKVTIGGVPLTAQNIEWSLIPGAMYFSTDFTVIKGQINDQLARLENPTFLEIEGSKEDILEALDYLGYTMEDTTDMTGTEVLKHYGQDTAFQKFTK